MPEGCGHDWEKTDVGFMVSGRTWKQGGTVYYCPRCRRFGTRTTLFLDGRFFKTDAEATNVNREEIRERGRAQAAWLSAHHPDHMVEEASDA